MPLQIGTLHGNNNEEDLGVLKGLAAFSEPAESLSDFLGQRATSLRQASVSSQRGALSCGL